MQHRPLMLALAICLSAGAPAGAQDPRPPAPDTSAPRLRRLRMPPRITVDHPTVIAFAMVLPDSVDSTFADYREVAERFGFDFVVSLGSRPMVLDVRYNAMHYVPTTVPAGFVLLVPGRRSDLVRGLVGSELLAERIRAYLAAVRPLGLGLK